MKNNPDRFQLPESYRVLQHAIPFRIPGFLCHYRKGNMTFAPGERSTEEWFQSFVDRVACAVGRSYLPICRVSDGELTVLLGEQPRYLLHPFPRRFRLWGGYLYRRVFNRRVKAATMAGVSSGNYARKEVKKFREEYGLLIADIAEHGLLAVHLSYTSVPFQQQFFPALRRWLASTHLELTYSNYIPFYFVYALLAGSRRSEILAGKRVLLINSASSVKRKCIERSLLNEGVRDIVWHTISPSRSYFDMIDIGAFRGKFDLSLIGAGIGKVRLFNQLESLAIPVIDAGYMFEVWAKPDMRWFRAYCVPDCDYQPERVRFFPPSVSVHPE